MTVSILREDMVVIFNYPFDSVSLQTDTKLFLSRRGIPEFF
jgi:hypothetical protein